MSRQIYNRESLNELIIYINELPDDYETVTIKYVGEKGAESIGDIKINSISNPRIEKTIGHSHYGNNIGYIQIDVKKTKKNFNSNSFLKGLYIKDSDEYINEYGIINGITGITGNVPIFEYVSAKTVPIQSAKTVPMQSVSSECKIIKDKIKKLKEELEETHCDTTGGKSKKLRRKSKKSMKKKNTKSKRKRSKYL